MCKLLIHSLLVLFSFYIWHFEDSDLTLPFLSVMERRVKGDSKDQPYPKTHHREEEWMLSDELSGLAFL